MRSAAGCRPGKTWSPKRIGRASAASALHMDGARLWESGPFYDRPYAEIAGLFDSVYVSFYKGLAGITGAILAGTRDFIAEARVWQRRQGGNLFHMYPYVLTARRGLEQRLPRMAEYHRKALEIAACAFSDSRDRGHPQPAAYSYDARLPERG